MQQPEIKKRKGISPIWILPIVALLVGGWLLYKGVRDAGIDIVVHFESAEGITAGKTKVIYKGIPIGIVRDMSVNRDMGSIALEIEIDKKAEKELVEDVKFWIVKPEVSAGRILEYTFSSRTLLAISCIYWLPKSRMAISSRFIKCLKK